MIFCLWFLLCWSLWYFVYGFCFAEALTKTKWNIQSPEKSDLYLSFSSNFSHHRIKSSCLATDFHLVSVFPRSNKYSVFPPSYKYSGFPPSNKYSVFPPSYKYSVFQPSCKYSVFPPSYKYSVFAPCIPFTSG